MFRLPQELTDKVLDYLHEDKLSLVYCSLVCWEWVPATRFHIFSDITLRRTWKRLMCPQFLPFLDMLATDSCTFTPFVTQLTLEDLDGTPGGAFTPAFSTLARLTSVSSLTFDRCRNLGVQPTLLPRLPALSELALVRIVFDSVRQVFSMLEMCPSLTSLAVVSVSWDPSSAPIVYSHASSIRRLRLSACPRAEFLDIFAASNVNLACRTVEIEGIEREEIGSIGRFLNSIAGSLQHLTVGFAPPNYTDSQLRDGGQSPGLEVEMLFCKSVDLRQHTRLLSFSFSDINVSVIGSEGALAMLSTIRCALCAPYLEEIAFSLFYYQKVDLGRLKWDRIDDLLSSSRLDSLRRVKFSVSRWNSSEDITSWLPRCCARNILIFMDS
ncbi:hypothetical protein DFH08DRAFT_165836 [Mycena albidolilacea]|uniref:F-box domain-containing protein n=1 Tax=Mycena albidolilacea TaxID=1033008 RepID=A0AAD7AQW3_9AGAR|nr:hypothetical protein DFH08DRAFT_165836 [Mycena albidolilacea]